MTRRSVGHLVVASLVAASFAPSLQPSLAAQTQPGTPQWYSVNIVRVKPEAANDWLALQQKETIPALQKIGVKQREAWQTAVFGEGFEYFFVQPIEKFAEYDNPQAPLVRALGQEGARVYNDKVRKMINGTQTLAVQAMPESITPPASYEPKLMILTFSYVAPGRGTDYANYLRNDLIPAIRKAKPTGYLLSRTIHGGDANEFVTARMIDRFADIDGPNLLTQALGADGAAKLTAKVAGIVQRQERRIYRFVPTLSFKPKATSSQ